MARLPTAPLTQNTITPPVEEYAAPDTDVTIGSEQSLGLTLQVPVTAVQHSLPGEFPLSLVLEAPTVDIQEIYNVPSEESLSLTLLAPTLQIDSTEDPADATSLTLTLLAPSLQIDSNVRPVTLVLTVSAGFSPNIGSLAPTIQRYIRDPIVNGGCPQCGTFLYKEYGAKQIRTEAVLEGRNFDIRGGDIYIRCSRCNWPVKVQRHPSHPIGAHTGWGLRYDEVEAGESDISYP